MQIYKARIVYDMVVAGEDSNDALKAIERYTEGANFPTGIERFTRVNTIDELPRGWTGDELAYCADPGVDNERDIKYWLNTGLS